MKGCAHWNAGYEATDSGVTKRCADCGGEWVGPRCIGMTRDGERCKRIARYDGRCKTHHEREREAHCLRLMFEARRVEDAARFGIFRE
jgi:hypothetical protein